MRFYVAEIVATGIAFLCALTNHAGACWVWRKLLKADLWATNIMDERGVNQMHRFAPPPELSARAPYSWGRCKCHSQVSWAGTGAAADTYRYCPVHGMVRES